MHYKPTKLLIAATLSKTDTVDKTKKIVNLF